MFVFHPRFVLHRTMRQTDARRSPLALLAGGCIRMLDMAFAMEGHTVAMRELAGLHALEVVVIKVERRPLAVLGIGRDHHASGRSGILVGAAVARGLLEGVKLGHEGWFPMQLSGDVPSLQRVRVAWYATGMSFSDVFQ